MDDDVERKSRATVAPTAKTEYEKAPLTSAALYEAVADRLARRFCEEMRSNSKLRTGSFETWLACADAELLLNQIWVDEYNDEREPMMGVGKHALLPLPDGSAWYVDLDAEARKALLRSCRAALIEVQQRMSYLTHNNKVTNLPVVDVPLRIADPRRCDLSLLKNLTCTWFERVVSANEVSLAILDGENDKWIRTILQRRLSKRDVTCVLEKWDEGEEVVPGSVIVALALVPGDADTFPHRPGDVFMHTIPTDGAFSMTEDLPRGTFMTFKAHSAAFDATEAKPSPPRSPSSSKRQRT